MTTKANRYQFKSEDNKREINDEITDNTKNTMHTTFVLPLPSSLTLSSKYTYP